MSPSLLFSLLLFTGCTDKSKVADDTGDSADTGDTADTDDTGEPTHPFPNLLVTFAGGLWGYNVDEEVEVDSVPTEDLGLIDPVDIRFGPGGLLISEGDTASGSLVRAVQVDMDGAYMIAASTGYSIPAAAYPSATRITGVEVDPDGDVLVSSFATNEILRFAGPETDPASGRVPGDFMEVFVTAGDGGLSGPADLTFGIVEGHLLVISSGTSDIKRFDGSTGAYIDDYIPAGVIGAPGAMAFHPFEDAMLYVTDTENHKVLRFNPGTPGAGEEFISGASEDIGGLTQPTGMIFDPDGDLYLSSFGTNEIKRFAGIDAAVPGAYLGEAASLAPTAPMHMAYAAGFLPE
jgi:hypothetical protein